MRVKAEARPLTDALAGGGQPGTTVVVEPLLSGEVELPERFLEGAGGPRMRLIRAAGVGTPRRRWWRAPVPVFLIYHPNAGPLLVDTGLHPSVATKPSANLGRFASWFSRPRISAGEDVSSQLRERGLDPRTIETVVLTHLHVDHASGIAEFPNATFVLADREWEAATTDRRPLLRGYRPAHYDYLFDYRTIDFDGPLIDSYASFGRTFDLYGDGSVRLAFTPGHSAGHLSVIARLRDRDFVIAGDAIYTAAQLTDGPPPPRPLDPHRWNRSQRELAVFARTYPQAVIVPGHDPRTWPELDRRYE